METKNRRAGEAGFSILEIIVVVALLAILALFTVPQLQRYVNRSHLEGFARQTAMLMHKAKMESIKRGVPTVVLVDFDTDQIIAFADVNDGGGAPISNLQYDPGPGSIRGAEDYEIDRLRLPDRLAFWGAADPDSEDVNAVWGFTDLPAHNPDGAVFDSNGSVRDRGAISIADVHGNFLEILVSPEATARVLVRKYNPDLAPGPDGSSYHLPGKHPVSGDRTWVWY